MTDFRDLLKKVRPRQFGFIVPVPSPRIFGVRYVIKGSAAGGVPAGFITPFVGPSVPSGYLDCSGQEVSRAMFPELFNQLGEQYGAGDGSTTFSLPDFRGRTL